MFTMFVSQSKQCISLSAGAQVEAFVAPTTESVQAVNSWLAQYNLTSESASPAGELLRINVPAHLANQIFAANFTEYNETTSATTQIGTLSYTIPSDVSDHITFAYPTTQYVHSELFLPLP